MAERAAFHHVLGVHPVTAASRADCPMAQVRTATAVAKEAVLAKRQMLLQQSDWTQLPDVPLATKETWAIYRQTLRDITEQTDPFNINWPVRPDRQS